MTDKEVYQLDRQCPQTEFLGIRCYKPLALALRLKAGQDNVDVSRLIRRLILQGLAAEGIKVPGFPLP